MRQRGWPSVQAWISGAESCCPLQEKTWPAIAKAIAAHEPVKMLVRAEEYDIAARLCGPSVTPRGTAHRRSVDARYRAGLREKSGRAVRRGRLQFPMAGAESRRTLMMPKLQASSLKRSTRSSSRQIWCLKAAVSRWMVREPPSSPKAACSMPIAIRASARRNANRNSRACWACEKSSGCRALPVWTLPTVTPIFYARFATPGVVVAGLDLDPQSYDHAVTQRHLDILRQSTDVKGHKLDVVVMPGPSTIRKAYENADFAAGYINFYVCNGAVIAPEFGDRKADDNARDALWDLFPGRDIIQVNIDGIAAGGGGIHCTTQQQPA